jgi:hypothetical protein
MKVGNMTLCKKEEIKVFMRHKTDDLANLRQDAAGFPL